MAFFDVQKVTWSRWKSDQNVKARRWPFSKYREIFRNAEVDGHFFNARRDEHGKLYPDIRYALIRKYYGDHHFVVFNLRGLHADRPHIISARCMKPGEVKRRLSQETDAPDVGQRATKTVLARGSATIRLYSDMTLQNG